VSTDLAIDEQVRAEQVEVIYRQAPPATVISIVVATMVVLSIWDVSDHRRLLVWLALVAVQGLMRIALVVAHRRAKGGDFRRWERLFVTGLIAIGITYGAGVPLIAPEGEVAHHAVLYFYLMGMAGGAVATYSAHTVAVIGSITGLMLPSTVWLALQPALSLKLMAVGGVLYSLAAFRATQMLAFFLRQSFQLTHELSQARIAAERLARVDELTGLSNRRAFRELAEQNLAQARRYAQPTAVVMLDVDHFKQINDRFGHAAGDLALKAVAETICRCLRQSDVAGRWGGEEFSVLLPQTAAADALSLAERLREAVTSSPVVFEGQRIDLTASFGVAAARRDAPALDELVRQADEALYEAKQSGRNRVALSRAAQAAPLDEPAR
jgi:diguanylate cyclase